MDKSVIKMLVTSIAGNNNEHTNNSIKKIIKPKMYPLNPSLYKGIKKEENMMTEPKSGWRSIKITGMPIISPEKKIFLKAEI